MIKLKFLMYYLLVALAFSNCGGDKKETKEKEEKSSEPVKDEKSSESSSKNEDSSSEDSASEAPENDEPQKAIVIAKSGLSLRAKPNGKSKLIKLLATNSIVKVLETGEEVTIKGKTAPWYKVQYGDKEGFAFGGYLQLGDKVRSTNSADAQTAGEETGQTSFANVIQKGLITANSGLTLRKTPSTNAQSITVIPKNREVGVLEFMESAEEIDGIDGVWCKVRYGKKEGYLFSPYINFSTATIVAKSGLTLRDTPQGDKLTVIPFGKVVYLVPPYINDNGEVTSDSVYTDENGVTWYRVRYGKFEGWSSGEFLEIESAGC